MSEAEPEPLTVLIAAADLLPALEERAGAVNGEVLAFRDTDALRALQVITKRRPHIVALERVFAATPRGAALINRIKADPTLYTSEIRVVSQDAEQTHVRPRPAPPPPDPDPPMTPTPAAGRVAAAVAVATAPAAAPPLDQRGTRRAQRYKIAQKIEILVDGTAALLVDLSAVGAQVVSATPLKPNQRVRIGLTDKNATLRFNASVAWAKFEIPPGSGARYRAGIEFVDAKTSAIDAYCARHRIT